MTFEDLSLRFGEIIAMESKIERFPRVLLMSMPWGNVIEPTLGLGILKSVLVKEDIECDVLELQMQLLRYLKYETYKYLSNCWGVNDFIWTGEYEKIANIEQLESLKCVCQDWQMCVGNYYRSIKDPSVEAETILRIRQEVVPKFLDGIMSDYDFSQYSLIGFTCLFDQTFASLALAKRIKQQFPNITIAFGGSAIAKPVGLNLAKVFHEMDVVAFGDGEPTIVPLVEASMGKCSFSEVPNIIYRLPNGEMKASETTVLADLDISPTPNYDAFFVQREELQKKHKISLSVGEMPIESSRGCWWGQKSHCIFCGIDEDALRYREKSGDLILKQLDDLHKRYGKKFFRFSDYIMPLNNYGDLFPKLIHSERDYVLHYEIKSNISSKQIDLCQKSGVRFVQPGIESFSNNVLKKIKKGVTGIQNIYTLYTLMKSGIFPAYNILFGFPDDEKKDYLSMLELIPSLYHLSPPMTVMPVLFTRYSRLVDFRHDYGISTEVKAHWRYDLLFSKQFFKNKNLDAVDFCYYYDDRQYRNFSKEMDAIYQAMQHQFITWWGLYHASEASLRYDNCHNSITITDTRFGGGTKVYKFGKVHLEISKFLIEKYATFEQITKALESVGVQSSEAEQALLELQDKRIIYCDGKHFVWLAFPSECYKSADWCTRVKYKREILSDQVYLPKDFQETIT